MNRYFLINGEKATDLGLHESKPVLAANKGTVYEAVFAERPVPSATEKVIESWEIVEDKYVQSFEVVDKTPLEMWHFPEFAKRIKASVASTLDPQAAGFISQLVLWWSAKDNVLKKWSDDNYLYFYCGEILEMHQAQVDANSTFIEIEDKPTE